MEPENDKYKKVVELLKKSAPVLNSAGEIENEVLKRINGYRQPKPGLSDLIDFLFGWVYIGWVRNSLVTASVFLIIFFVWQQGAILKRVDLISRQTIINGESFSRPTDKIEKSLMMFKLSGKRFPSDKITISEKQLEQFVDSVNKLQVKYKDLMNLINDDPELKNSIEKKLKEYNTKKTKI